MLEDEGVCGSLMDDWVMVWEVEDARGEGRREGS